MEKEQNTRIPQQERSIETRDKIIEAGYSLFSKKGYYKTTSKQIAKAAGVSIGSFYAYFTDKKELFKFILIDYLAGIKNVLKTINIEEYISTNRHRDFIRYIIDKLIEAHHVYPELHLEVDLLAQSDPEIKDILKKSKYESIDVTKKMLMPWKKDIKVRDIESASVVIQKSIGEVIHFTMFSEGPVNTDSILNELTEMIHRYLFAGK